MVFRNFTFENDIFTEVSFVFSVKIGILDVTDFSKLFFIDQLATHLGELSSEISFLIEPSVKFMTLVSFVNPTSFEVFRFIRSISFLVQDLVGVVFGCSCLSQFVKSTWLLCFLCGIGLSLILGLSKDEKSENEESESNQLHDSVRYIFIFEST